MDASLRQADVWIAITLDWAITRSCKFIYIRENGGKQDTVKKVEGSYNNDDHSNELIRPAIQEMRVLRDEGELFRHGDRCRVLCRFAQIGAQTSK
jgi:hypothetical protein